MEKVVRIFHSHVEAEESDFDRIFRMTSQEKFAAVEFCRRQYFLLKKIRPTYKVEKVVRFSKIN